jgi:hypothetical protein
VVRQFRTTLVLIAVIAVTTAAHRQIPAVPHTQQDDAFVPRPEVAKAMSLGFDAVLADYYWVQAVLLAGGASTPGLHATHLGRLIDVVTTLDPWVDHPYRFAAVWLTQSLEQVRHANRLLERSFEYHPDEWRNRFYLGFNQFFYLQDHESAADRLHEASQLPGSPVYLPRLVARLRSHSADLGAAALFLEEMVRTAPEEGARAQYQAALDEIEIEWSARKLDRARAAYQELWGEDIDFVEQLAMGSKAVVAQLPSPEPSSLPVPLRRGSRWVIDEEDGRIESTYLGRRYEVHVDPTNKALRARLWERDENAAAPGEPRAEVAVDREEEI